MKGKAKAETLNSRHEEIFFKMKKTVLTIAFALVAIVSFAGSIQFTTSCGDTYTVKYPDGMSTQELCDRLMMLDSALC